MKKNPVKKSVLALSMSMLAIGVAQAELSALHQQVIADHDSMQSMTAEQRRDFRAQIFGNSNKQTQRQYNQAYKTMMEAGNLAPLSSVGQLVNTEKSALRTPGTSITYDTGVGSGVVSGTSSFMQGNRFDNAFDVGVAAIHPVEATGSVTAVSFMMVANSGNVFFSMYDQIAGTTANQITSVSIPATAAPGSMNVHNFATALNYTGGEFLAGIWQLGAEGVDVDVNSVNGQGFHGIEINDGSPGTGLASLGNVNAIVRTSGNLTTPVELMNFEVE